MANDIQKNFNEKLQHFHLLCTNITMIVGFNSSPSSLSKVEQGSNHVHCARKNLNNEKRIPKVLLRPAHLQKVDIVVLM